LLFSVAERGQKFQKNRIHHDIKWVLSAGGIEVMTVSLSYLAVPDTTIQMDCG
jgi:hypothetical protein